MGEDDGAPVFLKLAEVAALARVTLETAESWNERRLIPGRSRPTGTRRVLYQRDLVMAWLKGEEVSHG